MRPLTLPVFRRRGRALGRARTGCGPLLGLLLCAVVSGCVTEAPPFTRCAGGAECAPPSDGCYELRLTRSDGSEAVGRQCSLRCAGDGDCPVDSVCLVLEGDPTATPLCLATCAAPEGCYRGLRCTEVEGPVDVLSVCLP